MASLADPVGVHEESGVAETPRGTEEGVRFAGHAVGRSVGGATEAGVVADFADVQGVEVESLRTGTGAGCGVEDVAVLARSTPGAG